MTKWGNTIDTPCVGICSTVYGDEVCRGCKRYYREIIDWNTFDAPAKSHVFHRLSSKMSDVVSRFLTVVDPELLETRLNTLQIRYHVTDDAACLAHHLLRAIQDKSANLLDYGIVINPEYAQHTLRELFNIIDSALYQKSFADYANT